jgi:integrase
LIATFLLTGGRVREVLGLETEGVSFDRQTVTFRPNAYRRLKTKKSRRTIPLWPQLAEILKPYADQRVVERGGTLLFPAADGGMLRDIRGLLDRIGARAG